MRALSATLKVLTGVTLGLALAELAFRARDDGAFPHLNLYEHDAALGVHLEPNAEMRLKLGTNPTTTVRTNALGFRGGDWPARGEGEVLVVGDSQVFGLGVEQDETFSAQLAALRKVSVLNAGVPTYGPLEYTALVERLGAERRPRHVVYVLNLSNDLFELGKPNAGRHRVWDGWAVRTETAPEQTTSFPFREWLMRRSHLVYATRRLLAGQANLSQESAGEGTWRDVIAASSSAHPLERDDSREREQLRARSATAHELDTLKDDLSDHVSTRIRDSEGYARAAKVLPPLQQGDPRDIVSVPFLEGARAVDATAHQLYLAALDVEGNDAKLRALATKTKDQALTALLDKRRELRAKLATDAPQQQRVPTALEEQLAKTKRACDAVGAELLVVALPLDVMVSADEWKKYRRPPIDLALTKVLLDDVVSRAEAVGARALDPTAALAKAEPGAFLDGDLHLTPKGHRALAEAITAALDAPPRPRSQLALPDGRSWPPTEDEWRAVAEVNVKGSTAANCETKQVREWFLARCKNRYDDEERTPSLVLREVKLVRGGHGDALLLQGLYGVREVMLPVLEGDTATLVVDWEDHERTLTLEHPVGGAPKRTFSEPKPHAARPDVTFKREDEAGRPCDRGLPFGRRQNQCWDVADPLRDVDCPEGTSPSGALRRCAKRCAAATDCAPTETCHPWPGGDFCGAP